MTGQFSRLSAAAVVDLRLSAASVRVLAMLACYADKHGHCFPAVTTIADRLNLDRRGVQRHIRKLENAGYIEREPTLRATKGGWGRNRYWLRYPPLPPSNAVIATLGDAVPGAASDIVSEMLSPETTAAMRHQRATDAVLDVASDAVPQTAQTISMNYPNGEQTIGHAHVRSRRDGIIEYEDGSWEPDPEAPSPTPAPIAQQRKSPTQAPTPKWERPKRPPKPQDRVTEMAKHLSVVPGFDLKLAWEAILSLPSEVQTRMEQDDLPMTELIDELKRLDLGDSAAWRRAQNGLAAMQAAND